MESFTYSQETDGEKKENDNKGSRRETEKERERVCVHVCLSMCPYAGECITSEPIPNYTHNSDQFCAMAVSYSSLQLSLTSSCSIGF